MRLFLELQIIQLLAVGVLTNAVFVLFVSDTVKQRDEKHSFTFPAVYFLASAVSRIFDKRVVRRRIFSLRSVLYGTFAAALNCIIVFFLIDLARRNSAPVAMSTLVLSAEVCVLCASAPNTVSISTVVFVLGVVSYAILMIERIEQVGPDSAPLDVPYAKELPTHKNAAILTIILALRFILSRCIYWNHVVDDVLSLAVFTVVSIAGSAASKDGLTETARRATSAIPAVPLVILARYLQSACTIWKGQPLIVVTYAIFMAVYCALRKVMASPIMSPNLLELKMLKVYDFLFGAIAALLLAVSTDRINTERMVAVLGIDGNDEANDEAFEGG